MELRGFDSYEVTLGDRMRGERASLGKTLQDAERELRIKASMLVGIEECNLGAFKSQSVIPGYVRSYSRYLGLDPDDCYRQFCDEAGFSSPTSRMLGSDSTSTLGAIASSIGGQSSSTQIDQSRFAAPPGRNRFQARISLGALTSTMALLALIAGLAYGGYALLQDIQRVAIAPLPQAPVVIAEAPSIAPPAASADGIARPSASDYAKGGALAAYTGPTALPMTRLRRRDGPISAIDPAEAGTFTPARPTLAAAPEAPASPDPSARGDDDDTRTVLPDPNIRPRKPGVPPIPRPRLQLGIVIHASAKSWIKVTDRNSVTIWQGILEPGGRYQLPKNVLSPVVRSGNAGKTFVLVDGVPYGPLGEAGTIARDVELDAGKVRAELPRAEPALLVAEKPPVSKSADARTKRP